MISPSEIAERLAAGDHIGAERRAREALARDPADAGVVRLFGVVLRETGRAAEAVDILSAAFRAVPGDAALLEDLANSQRDSGQYRAASASFREHARLTQHSSGQSLEEAVACEVLVGDRAEAARLLIGAGLMPAGLALESKKVMAAAQARRLDNRQAIALLRVLAKGQDIEARTRLAEALWRSEDPAERAMAAYDLPNLLYRLGRTEDAMSVYADAVEQGFPWGISGRSGSRAVLPRLTPCSHRRSISATGRLSIRASAMWAACSRGSR